MGTIAIKTLWCFIFIFCLFNEAGAASLKIQATPPDINMIDIKPLTILCTFQQQTNASTNIHSLESLTISKLSQSPRSFDILSTLTASDPNTPSQPLPPAQTGITSVDGKLTRDTLKLSQLSVTWSNPTTTKAGTYICSANALSDVGAPIVFTQETVVREDSVLVTAQKLKSLEKELSDQQACCRLATAHLVEFEVWRKTVSTSLKYFGDNLIFNRSSEYKNRTYAASLFTVSDADVAQAVCQTMGGHMAEVDDAQEWTFLENFLKASTMLYLIGGRDDIQEGGWYWTHSEKPLTFAPWGTGEPNNSGNEDCLEIVVTSTKRYLNDISCLYLKRGGFICEIPNAGSV